MANNTQVIRKQLAVVEDPDASEYRLRKAVQTLADHGDRSTVTSLLPHLDRLLRHHGDAVSRATLDMLIQIGDERVEQTLIGLLRDPPWAPSRTPLSLASALAALGGKRTMRTASALLRAGPGPKPFDSRPIRKSAARILGEMGDERVIGALRAAAREREEKSYVYLNNPGVGQVAQEALEQVEERVRQSGRQERSILERIGRSIEKFLYY